MLIRTERDPRTVTVTVDPSRSRATPEPADRRFREVLRDSADALLVGVESATRVLPGGALVSAAVRTARESASAAEGTEGGGRTAVSSFEEALARQAESQMHYIELQQRIQDENRRFTTLSNVLKARHETAKTAIGNIR
jgi:hypothetical protein